LLHTPREADATGEVDRLRHGFSLTAMRITFFTHKRMADIQRIGFYLQDIEILRHLGHDVRLANRPGHLLRRTDLYYVWWWTGAFLPIAIARARRIPVVVTGVFNYALPPSVAPDYVHRPWWHRRLIAYGLRAADANIFLSAFEHTQVSSQLRVRNPRMIPLVVDTERYAPDDRPRDPDLVLNVAWSGLHNTNRKCLVEIIDSIPAVIRVRPQTRYVFCGTPGERHEELVARVRRLGLERHVEFRGYVSDDAKLDLMRRCAVYLSPSRFEGFGLAIAEAMSCGAAVVTSPVGSLTEVVGSHGRLVEGTDPAAIAEATLDLLAHPEHRAALGKAARAHIVPRYHYTVRRDGLATLIEEVT
jgi:glycosyltransferase involved in cell wall biosynthesis